MVMSFPTPRKAMSYQWPKSISYSETWLTLKSSGNCGDILTAHSRNIHLKSLKWSPDMDKKKNVFKKWIGCVAELETINLNWVFQLTHPGVFSKYIPLSLTTIVWTGTGHFIVSSSMHAWPDKECRTTFGGEIEGKYFVSRATNSYGMGE